MNISKEHISQCNQSEPLADASGRIVDLMNENGLDTTNSTFSLDDSFRRDENRRNCSHGSGHTAPIASNCLVWIHKKAENGYSRDQNFKRSTV